MDQPLNIMSVIIRNGVYILWCSSNFLTGNRNSQELDVRRFVI